MTAGDAGAITTEEHERIPIMAYGDIMDRLNDTRPVKSSNYNAFIPDGNHDLVVCSIEPYQNQEQAFCVRATFVCETSDNPQVQPGMLFDAVWNLDKPAPFPGGERDKDRFAAFLNALQGVETSPTSHQGLARACLKTRAEGGQLEVQPCRGARIKAEGRTRKPGPKSKPDAKPYTMVTYRHVDQSGETVRDMRLALDARMPYSPRPQQVPVQQMGGNGYPQQQAAPVQQPSSGWGAPQPAPAQPAPQQPAGQWAGFFPPKG